MKTALLILVVTALALAQQDKVTTAKTDDINYSAWYGNPICGGLRAEVWSDAKGWHSADCLEIAEKVAELRDIRNVLVSYGPDVPQMLAYPQYGDQFRISRKDFQAAQDECRKNVRDGFATPHVVEHCKTVVAGVVPYGLKLK